MSIVAASAWSGLAAILIKFVLAIALLFFMSAALQRAIRNIAPVQPPAVTTRAVQQQEPAASTSVRELQTPVPPPAMIHVPTPQEFEEQRRRSAEALEILRASTREIPDDPRRRSVLQ